MVCVNSHVEDWPCGCQLFGRVVSLLGVVEVLMVSAATDEDSPASATMGKDDEDDDDPSWGEFVGTS